jgi:hypothetical protein
MPRDSAVTGAAGEHFALYRLHERGLIAALAPLGAHQADIIVFSPEMSVGSMVQVKTRTKGRDGGWHMSTKHESIIHERLFYAFVDLEPNPPVVYVIPSAVVADVVRRSHTSWLSLPGKGGRVRQDSKVRRLLPIYPHEVDGFPPGWLERYRERWDYLTEDPRLSDATSGVEGNQLTGDGQPVR